MPEPVQWATTHDPGRHGHDGNLALVNAYAEMRGSDGKSNVVWYAAEGLVEFAPLEYGGPVQGMIEVDGTLTVVAARQVYQVTLAGDVTHVGGFPVDGPVTLAANRKASGAQVGICAGGLLSVLEGGVVTAVTPSIAGPNSIAVLDGFAVVANNLGQIGVSGLDEMTAWDPLDVATANAHRDGIARAFVWKRTLILAGTSSTEFWANTGDSFPFAPVSGTANSLGSRSPASFVEVPVGEDDTALFWVATDNTVRRATGYSGRTVSNAEVERRIEATEDKSQIRASVYVRPKHAFYVLSGPTWTRVYDATNDRWHARESYPDLPWKVGPVARLGDLWIGGDVADGKLYRITEDAHDEAGDLLVWRVRGLLSGYPSGVQMPALWLDTIPGSGLNTTDEHNADPQVMVRISKDMGMTWGPWRSFPVGKIGEHHRRVKTTRWGKSDEDGFLIEVSMSAAVVRGLTGGAAEITGAAA